MLIFIKEKLVFFATPKTASTSVELALGPSADIRISRMPNAKHTPFRKYKRLLEPFVMTLTQSEPDTVAVIREPVDWLGSWYRYRSRDDVAGTPASTAQISFDQFVEGYLSDDQPEFARVGSQTRFMSDKDGEVGLSHLFRYDNIEGLVRFLQGRLGRQFQLGHANTSPKAELLLSPSLRSEYERAHKADFDLYERLGPSAMS